MCHLVARGIYIRWQHLIFVLCTIVQLYKEDWGILHMLGCLAIALPSTEQIFKYCKYKGGKMGKSHHENAKRGITNQNEAKQAKFS